MSQRILKQLIHRTLVASARIRLGIPKIMLRASHRYHLLTWLIQGLAKTHRSKLLDRPHKYRFETRLIWISEIKSKVVSRYSPNQPKHSICCFPSSTRSWQTLKSFTDLARKCTKCRLNSKMALFCIISWALCHKVIYDVL